MLIKKAIGEALIGIGGILLHYTLGYIHGEVQKLYGN